MKSWDQDDPHELLGTHAFLPGATAQLPLAPLTSEAQAPTTCSVHGRCTLDTIKLELYRLTAMPLMF